MKCSFNLVFPKQEESPLRLIITHRGKVYRKSVGLTVKSAPFLATGRTGNMKIDKELRLIRLGVESCLDELSSPDQIQAVMRRVYDGQWHDAPQARKSTRAVPTFWEYADDYALRDTSAKRQRKSNLALVADLMGRGDDWNDIDSAWFFRLEEKMNERKLSKNYQGTIIARVKAVMGEGAKLKYHSCDDFRDAKKPQSQTDSVYLTEKELEAVYNLELKDELMAKVRDLFIIGCYTGARFEDYSQFNKDNIKGKEFFYIQRKTGARVTLPLSPKLKECLKRNGWKSPDVGQTVFNKYIKKVCCRAGINERMQVRISKGSGYEHRTLFKYQLVSSHTCRRTLCTRLAQEKVPLNQIMIISGHKSLTSLQKYLRQTEQDQSDTLGKIGFFK